jgi:hypothetical protein
MMLRRDDPEATVAEGRLIETEAGPLPALALKRDRERIRVPGYGARLPLMRLGAGWLRGPLILIVPTGFASRLPPVSA